MDGMRVRWAEELRVSAPKRTHRRTSLRCLSCPRRSSIGPTCTGWGLGPAMGAPLLDDEKGKPLAVDAHGQCNSLSTDWRIFSCMRLSG